MATGAVLKYQLIGWHTSASMQGSSNGGLDHGGVGMILHLRRDGDSFRGRKLIWEGCEFDWIG